VKSFSFHYVQSEKKVKSLDRCIDYVYSIIMKIATNQTTTKRVDFTLPAKTLNLLRQAAPKGKRSEFVDHALRVYISHLKQKALKKAMREEALANAEQDLQLTNEWFALDEEAWRQVK